MNKLYTLLIITFTIQISHSQNQWQEHLSHDRRAYSHLGHFLVDNELVLVMGNNRVPMNTLETIKGNSKKSQQIIGDYFTFEAKTTRTGFDSKEVLLINAHDYDISGYGTFSLHLAGNTFTIRDIYGNLDYNTQYDLAEFHSIRDAHLLGGPLSPKECITYDKRYFLNEDDMITSEMDLDSRFAYHEGLDGDVYQVENDLFRRLVLPFNGSIELGEYYDLLNDPYNNQLVVRKGNNLNRYAYEDLTFVKTDSMVSPPLDIQFVEGGLYYLTESETSYSVFYYSEANSDSELFYELPKSDEVVDFNIRSIEVVGEDIYFMGLWKPPFNKGNFSYVQKHTVGNDFTPIRKDIELTSVSATREALEHNEFKYTYKMTVKNLSEDTIRHFTSYLNLYTDFGPDQYEKTDVDLILPPGESIEIDEREFSFYGFPLNSLIFSIPGVDFGMDSDMTNNSFTADVVVLSNEETDITSYRLSPNPSSNMLHLKGNLDEIETICISNITGRILEISNQNLNNLDISFLPKGQYWLEIKTKSHLEQHPFIKI